MSIASTRLMLMTNMSLNVASNPPFLANLLSFRAPWPSSKHHASYLRFSKKSTQLRQPTTCL